MFLVSQNDTCTDDLLPVCDASCWTRKSKSRCQRTGLDMRCPAMLQGWNRNLRGRLFMKHLQNYYGRPTHTLVEVPGAGHEAAKVYRSQVAHQAIFSA